MVRRESVHSHIKRLRALPPDSRLSFVEELTHSDPELTAQLLCAYCLESDGQSDDLFQPVDTSEGAVSTDSPPSSIGSYEIIE